MDKEEKEMLEDHNTLVKKILKSLLYTFFVFIFSLWGIYALIANVFHNLSVEQSNTWAIISICIGIIFTLFFCTFTILDEIKKNK